MSIEVGLLIAIGTFVLSFVVALTTSKKANKEEGSKEGYERGILTQKLVDIDKKLEKIERRLDFYDSDIEKKVEEEMEKHVLKYHNGGI